MATHIRIIPEDLKKSIARIEDKELQEKLTEIVNEWRSHEMSDEELEALRQRTARIDQFMNERATYRHRNERVRARKEARTLEVLPRVVREMKGLADNPYTYSMCVDDDSLTLYRTSKYMGKDFKESRVIYPWDMFGYDIKTGEARGKVCMRYFNTPINREFFAWLWESFDENSPIEHQRFAMRHLAQYMGWSCTVIIQQKPIIQQY